MAPTKKSPGGERCLLAHDLINDLSVILGRCELLSELKTENADVARHLQMVQQAAKHMFTKIAERPCLLASGRAETTHSLSRHEDSPATVDSF
jgi:signal transduction histidine kinase